MAPAIRCTTTTYALRGAEIEMYNQNNVPPPEYRVRTVARYVVTRYCHSYTHIPDDYKDGDSVGICGGSSEVIGEFENEQRAFEVAHAMARTEPVATVNA